LDQAALPGILKALKPDSTENPAFFILNKFHGDKLSFAFEGLD